MTDIPREDRLFALIDANKSILYKVAGAYCKNSDDRSDLIQEILIQLWRSFERFDERRKFTTWMYRVAMNVAISFSRRERRRAPRLVPLDASGFDLAIADRAMEDAGSDVALLREYIERMDELDRALALLYLDGYPHGEIAEILGISPSNVSTKIARIKERLRRDFQETTTEKTT